MNEYVAGGIQLRKVGEGPWEILHQDQTFSQWRQATPEELIMAFPVADRIDHVAVASAGAVAAAATLVELVDHLRTMTDHLELSRAAIEEQLDIVKTASTLIRKIQRFEERNVVKR